MAKKIDNKDKDWKAEYIRLRKAVNKYLKVNREKDDFMHEHLRDLADQEAGEYEVLCDAVCCAAAKL